MNGYFFNRDYSSLTRELLDSKSISEIELQFKSYSIILLFQMEKSKETNELINLINLNGIKLLLD